MAPTRRPSMWLSTRTIPDRTKSAQPSGSYTDDETQESSPYHPTFVNNNEPEFQPITNMVANRIEWQNLLAGVHLMLEIPGLVYNHNVPYDIHRDCSVEEHGHDGNNDDSETEQLEVSLDSGTQNTNELIRWVIDDSKVQTIGTYVD